jgi:hypothetical protein
MSRAYPHAWDEALVRDHDVPHSRDARPRDARLAILQTLREALRRLSDDLDVPDDRGTHFLEAKNAALPSAVNEATSAIASLI